MKKGWTDKNADNTNKMINKKKIEKIKARIKAGFYNDPEILDWILDWYIEDVFWGVTETASKKGNQSFSKSRLAQIQHRLMTQAKENPKSFDNDYIPFSIRRFCNKISRCPIGDGNAYRNLIAEGFFNSFDYVVDEPVLESSCGSGRDDIELPLRLEVVSSFSLWAQWSECYRIKSIVIEAKNTKEKVGIRDVQQIKYYLENGGKGRLGILVSRSGFNGKALIDLKKIAADYDYLIIPFTHEDVINLVKAKDKSIVSTMEFIRKKESSFLME